jgi:hypothetical protein
MFKVQGTYLIPYYNGFGQQWPNTARGNRKHGGVGAGRVVTTNTRSAVYIIRPGGPNTPLSGAGPYHYRLQCNIYFWLLLTGPGSWYNVLGPSGLTVRRHPRVFPPAPLGSLGSPGCPQAPLVSLPIPLAAAYVLRPPVSLVSPGSPVCPPASAPPVSLSIPPRVSASALILGAS